MPQPVSFSGEKKVGKLLAVSFDLTSAPHYVISLYTRHFRTPSTARTDWSSPTRRPPTHRPTLVGRWHGRWVGGTFSDTASALLAAAGTYAVRNMCNVCLTQTMGEIISSICIRTAAADSIGYRVPAWYRSNPKIDIILSVCAIGKLHCTLLPIDKPLAVFEIGAQFVSS